jgi:nitrogen fixation protein NifU and related proteins
MDKETKREIILDNYQHPTNKGLKEDDSYIKENTRSNSCIDNIDLMMKIEDGIVVDACFDGEACAICTSSTSIIVKSLIGKSVNDAKEIIKNYQNMINEEDYNPEILGELNVFDEIYMQPARKNCALLSSKSAVKILDGVDK